MAYLDVTTGKIVSQKHKSVDKKDEKAINNRVWEMVWWIDERLKLKVWRVKENKNSNLSVLLKDWTIVIVSEIKVRKGNDDDY
mgnify:CR=1 FL=1